MSLLAFAYQVQAGNVMGLSEWSEKSELVTTLTSIAEKPGQPWAEPECGITWLKLRVERPYDNGAPITSFKVERREISMYVVVWCGVM